jgi:hypothetical protein
MSPAGPPRPDAALSEVIFESTRQGAYVRCAAIHVATGIEVSAFGSVHEPHAVQQVALAKLRRALERAGRL